jgi:hypothetical protein
MMDCDAMPYLLTRMRDFLTSLVRRAERSPEAPLQTITLSLSDAERAAAALDKFAQVLAKS